jgi:8-oxo-dGTP pyrophosphatase MutT (NUDIX family)
MNGDLPGEYIARLPINTIQQRINHPPAKWVKQMERDGRIPEGILIGEVRRAAVLIPFLWEAEEWKILFIRRTEVVGDIHSGQVAFPGGAADSGDNSPEATALREAEEEIGIRKDRVNILGRLPEMTTISNYLLTPVVGILEWPQTLYPEPKEVSRVFTISLRWLADPKNYDVSWRRFSEFGRKLQVITFAEYEGEILWGVSAYIMHNLIKLLTHPDFFRKSAG